MKFYDIDNDGNITYEEFIRGLRQPLNERRLKMVKKVFIALDKEGSGIITVEDIINIYDVTKDKNYQNGKKAKK